MLTIIGEAVKNISIELREEYPEIPWREAAGMRDKIIHHYFGVDYDAIFLTITNDLPLLKEGIQKILDEYERPGNSKIQV